MDRRVAGHARLAKITGRTLSPVLVLVLVLVVLFIIRAVACAFLVSQHLVEREGWRSGGLRRGRGRSAALRGRHDRLSRCGCRGRGLRS